MKRDILGADKRMLSKSGFITGNVLEVGCGDGWFTNHLADMAYCLTAIDTDSELVSKAKQTFPKVQFYVAGLDYFVRLCKQKFDVVVFSFSLHHMKDPGNAMQLALQILYRNGVIVIIEPDARTQFNQAFAPYYDRQQVLNNTLEHIKKGQGYRIIDIQNYDSYWHFDDANDFINYIAKNDRFVRDADKDARVKEALASSVTPDGIRVSETINLFVLQKST